jgi:alkylation response protein AidB-like acyl-CoA dehydrogenase
MSAAPEVSRTQDRMTHDIWLPAETVALRAEARATVEKCVAPLAAEIGSAEESVDSFPWEAFRGLAEGGLYAVPWATPFGRGLEHRMLGTCTVTEEIAYHCSSMAGVYDGQAILVPQAVSFARPDVQQRIVPGLISGDLVGSFATSEPEASSDLRPSALRTVAEPASGGGLRITGRKRWITNSVVADWAAVLCRQGEAATMVLVDMKNSPGVRVGRPDLKMGHRGQITADIVLDDVFVPEEHILGGVGRGLSVAFSCLVRGRIGIGAAGVGVAQAALDLAVNHLRTRQAFDAPLGRLQHWQFLMAQRATEIECARTLYQKAAMLLDGGHPTGEPEAAMAKAMGSRVAVDTVRDAIQAHGALGFVREIGETGVACRLETMHRDAKVLEIFEGANELQQWVIARNLIGRDVTG